ncbi:hypothetical protein AAMO2058_001203300 [Amorphochlora amoebiformis]
MATSALTPRGWMTELERLQRSFRSIQSRVRESKNRGELYGGPNVKKRYRFKKDVEKIEKNVTTLDEMLSRMEDLPRKFEITTGELSRRRGLLTRLKNDVVNISNIVLRSREVQQNDEFDFSTPQVEESLETRHLTNQQLIQRQHSEEIKQEEHLDDILRGVTTLKDIGYNINTELSHQTDLLDGLEQGIDKTDRNIQRNTRSVQRISVHSTSCWPMFIMIFLAFVIVILLVL